MKSKLILTISIAFIFLAACEREDVNRNTTEESLPANIIYQTFDTTSKTFITTESYNLYQDTNQIYLDSFSVQFYTNPFITFPFNYSLFNSRKYVRANFLDTSDDISALIKFDNTGRITAIHDRYSISADATTSGGDFSNNEIGYTDFPTGNILSHFASIGLIGPTMNQLSYNFDIIAANNDSMNVVSGYDDDGRALKYTVIFESADNNTNIMQLSGYLFEPFKPVYQRVSNLFFFTRRLPMPKLNMKLAKSIYVTESLDMPRYKKVADFSYEYDGQNRLTKATIIYSVNSLFSGYPDVTQRILFNY